jgi:hypothetical protein
MSRVDVFQPKTNLWVQSLAKRRVRKVIDRVVIKAKARAVHYTGNSTPKPDGALALSIKGNVQAIGKVGVLGTVTASARHANLVHDGAPPHIISPRPGGGLLFFWRRKGRFVCMKRPVHHPGFKGKHYLTIPLREEALKAGFVLVTPHAAVRPR